MKIFSIKKTVLGLFLLAGVALNSNAVEIGIGARLGFENEFSTSFSKNNKGTFGDSKVLGFGAAMQMGIFADIMLTDWFAVTPGLNISLFRGTTTGKQYLVPDGEGNWDKSKWSKSTDNFTAIDFDVLAKFMYGNWYGGVGLGMTFLTAPSTTSVSSEGNKTKSSNNTAGRISMNIVMDAGLYFPLMDSDNHFLITGVRTTYDIFALFANNNMSAKIAAEVDPNSRKTVAATPFTAAFTVGYMYKF